MLVNNKRKRGVLWIEDVDFCHDYLAHKSKCDIVYFYGYMGPKPSHSHGIDRTSMMMNLSVPESDLWSGMRKSVRREIRKLEESGEVSVRIIRTPTPQDLSEFIMFYNHFVSEKGIEPDDGLWLSEAAPYVDLLYAIHTKTGEVLAGLADLIDMERSCGAYAFSHHRTASTPEKTRLHARATKMLYWRSLLNAKEQGSVLFDLGDMPEKGEEEEGVAHFKSGFGGKPVRTSEFYLGYSLLGKLAIFFFKLTKKRIHTWD